ncbi:MAG: hypothetical protein U1F43_10610 [Myxococcota bacterium]
MRRALATRRTLAGLALGLGLAGLGACTDDGAKAECCPIESPSCGCFALGGSASQVGGCRTICDAPPVGWTRGVDENGCAVWKGGPSGSCLPTDVTQPSPDAGAETVDSSSDAAAETVDDTAVAPDAPDAVDVADANDSEVADVADAADTTPPGEVDPIFGHAGSIRIIEQFSDAAGEVTASYALISMADGPPVPHLALALEDGDCRLYAKTDATCTPACANGELCDASGVCRMLPAPRSAGDIALDGLKAKLVGEYSGGLYYTVTPDAPAGGLFDAGDSIAVAAAGAAGFPAFQAAVSGVGDLHTPSDTNLVELVDGKAADVAWTPANDGSSVEVTLQLGWHGAPPTGIIFCRAPDAAGKVHLSPAIISGFPYFGGVGLFQVQSWMERVSRAEVDGPFGPIEVVASSRTFVYVTHTAE